MKEALGLICVSFIGTTLAILYYKLLLEEPIDNWTGKNL